MSYMGEKVDGKKKKKKQDCTEETCVCGVKEQGQRDGKPSEGAFQWR